MTFFSGLSGVHLLEVVRVVGSELIEAVEDLGTLLRPGEGGRHQTEGQQLWRTGRLSEELRAGGVMSAPPTRPHPHPPTHHQGLHGDMCGLGECFKYQALNSERCFCRPRCGSLTSFMAVVLGVVSRGLTAPVLWAVLSAVLRCSRRCGGCSGDIGGSGAVLYSRSLHQIKQGVSALYA